VGAGLAAATVSGLVAATAVTPVRGRWWLRAFAWVVAVSCAVTLLSYLHGTLRGKFRIWEEELDRLALRGDETVVDLGCGRGLVLLAAAARLPRGRAIGVDVWRGVDQSGNGPEATRANADILGVADRVELHTADVRDLPLPDGCADVVVSSLVCTTSLMRRRVRRRWVRPFVCCGRVDALCCSTSPTWIATPRS